MIGKRKRLNEKRYTLRNLLHSVDCMKEDIGQFSSDENAQHMLTTLHEAIRRIEAAMNDLPIGHRFTGTYYLKEPYSNPVRITKIQGSAYMKEDLVSWAIEPDGKPSERYGYFRQIYHDPGCEQPLAREDGEAVFQPTEQKSQ